MPTDTRQLLQNALQLHQRNQFPQAESMYRQILVTDPNHVDALRYLALLAHQTARHDEAVRLIQRSIQLNPSIAHSYNTLGEALRALGKPADAEHAYRTALKLKDNFPEAWNNLASALQQQDRSDDAIDAYQKAIALRPNYFRAYVNLGTVHLSRGEVEPAEQHLRNALSIDPNFPPAHAALAEALARQGKSAEALAEHQVALRANPDDPDLIDAFARTLRSLNRLPESIAAYRAAIQLRPTDPRLHVNLGEALHHAGQVAPAIDALTRALQLDPNLSEAHNNLATALTAVGRHDQALAHLRAALAIKPNYTAAHSNLLLHLHYTPHTPRDIFQEHLNWAKRLSPSPRDGERAGERGYTSSSPREPRGRVRGETPGNAQANFIKPHQPDLIQPTPPPHHSTTPPLPSKVRLAYISPDLWRHPVAYFLEPLLQHHDRTRFELFIYSDTAHTDDVTDRLRACVPHWRDTRAFTDDQLSARIRADRIDILIDLAGHTAANRLPVFAQKPAPTQITYLGYPDTTGLPEIDYRITDPTADPQGLADQFHSEKLIRLPHCFLCYAPPPDAPTIAPLPAAHTGHITFGSFNRIAKISPDCLRLWSRILQALPTARLLIKSTYLADDGTRNQVRHYFLSHDIPNDRLDIHPPIQGFTNHLDAYNTIDIALDTFPYNGTTTTCESLWMGVPVITLAGQTHVARVGASLLTSASLAELIASTPDAYVQLAIELATDLPRLATYRQTLRTRLSSSPLLDAPAFTRAFETSLQQIFR